MSWIDAIKMNQAIKMNHGAVDMKERWVVMKECTYVIWDQSTVASNLLRGSTNKLYYSVPLAISTDYIPLEWHTCTCTYTGTGLTLTRLAMTAWGHQQLYCSQQKHSSYCMVICTCMLYTDSPAANEQSLVNWTSGHVECTGKTQIDTKVMSTINVRSA